MAETTSQDKQALLTEFLSRICRRKPVGKWLDQVLQNIPAAVLVSRSGKITNAHALVVLCNILRKKESSPSVAAWLTDLLQHKNPRVRSAAAEALGDLGVRSAAPQIYELFKDTANPVYVRDNCAMALGLLRASNRMTLQAHSSR